MIENKKITKAEWTGGILIAGIIAMALAMGWLWIKGAVIPFQIQPQEQQAFDPVIAEYKPIDKTMLYENVPVGSVIKNEVDIIIPKDATSIEFPSLSAIATFKAADRNRVLAKGTSLTITSVNVVLLVDIKNRNGFVMDLKTDGGFEFRLASQIRPTIGQMEPMFTMFMLASPEVIK